ncbi:MAG TPA: CmcI family methyltransferase [Thermoanaerobaculia bacterium]
MITIDEKRSVVIVERDGESHTLSMNSPEAFAAISDAWLRAGWYVKHPYTFTWLGRPIIQLPEDIVRIQELIFRVQPDVIIETGIAHGGSLILSASLCKLLGRGRVIGIDIEIRPHNRAALEAHPLFPLITLIEGSSVDTNVVAQVKSAIRPGETVLVLLDSNHTKEHVLRELDAYAPLVTPDSYIVAMDGHIMELAAGAPRTSPEWMHDNPKAAAAEFARAHPEFVVEEPPFLFNESAITQPVSYFSGGFLKRIR